MRQFLARAGRALAPRVCDDCEGGSGMVYNPRVGAVMRCTSCNGAGVAEIASSRPQAQVLERLAGLASSPDEPRSVA